MLGSHSTLQSTKVLLKKLSRSWKTAQKDTFVWRICNCLTLAPLGFFETLLKLNHSGSRTCNCSPCQKTDLRKEQPEPETKLQHRLCTTFSGTTPQDQILPRLNTSTEVRQGQEFLREEILAAPKFHNMISKPLTEDLELAHVVFFSLQPEGIPPWKGPSLEQFVNKGSPWEGLMLEEMVEDCLPWEWPHAGAGEGHLSLRRKQWQKHLMSWLFPFSCASGKEEAENQKLS